MTKEYLTFPTALEYTIKRKTNKTIDISLYGGSSIQNSIFNLSFIEPFKIVFVNKKKRKNVICFMLNNVVNGKNKYDFYIGSIEKDNKRSLTAILNFVNQSL